MLLLCPLIWVHVYKFTCESYVYNNLCWGLSTNVNDWFFCLELKSLWYLSFFILEIWTKVFDTQNLNFLKGGLTKIGAYLIRASGKIEGCICYWELLLDKTNTLSCLFVKLNSVLRQHQAIIEAVLLINYIIWCKSSIYWKAHFHY